MSRDRWSAGGGSRSRRGSLHHVYRGLIERNEPGKDAAESEVGLVEVVTDVFEPPAEPDGGRAQSVATTTQRRQDHAHVHAGGQNLANQGIGDLLHQLAVPPHNGSVPRLDELRAPSEDGQHPVDLLGVLRLEHAQARMEPLERHGQSIDRGRASGTFATNSNRIKDITTRPARTYR